MRTAATVCATALVALAVYSPAPARADGSKSNGAPRATLYVDPGARPTMQTRTVTETLGAFLDARSEVDFVPIKTVLAPDGPVEQDLAKAAKLAVQGRNQLANLEVEQGLASLTEAVTLREKHFHHLAKKSEELEKQALLLGDLAMANFLSGEEEKSRQTILQAFILNPKLEFDAQRFPPQMKRTFDESRFLADELGTGNTQVSTTPEGAEVWANGNFVGYSPILVRGLAAGRNLITVSRVGYQTQTLAVKVDGGTESTQISMELKPSPGNPLEALKAALAEAQKGSKTKAAQTAAVAQLKTPVLLMALVEGKDEVAQVTLHAFNGLKGRSAGKVTGTVSALDPDPECRELVKSAITSLFKEPVLVAQPEPPRESWFSRATKSRYFWPVVGSIAAAAVAGAAVGIYYGTRSEGTDHRRTLILLPAGAGGRF